MSGKWLLPEGIEEVLPPQAAELEALCRRILDEFFVWGYELVMPPLVEYLDSLLTGVGEDLELQTFKVTDQLNGKLLGLRADATPQVTRIEARRLRRESPSRLCYLGAVLRTLPNEPGGTRAPLQVGAELYGHGGLESDAEVLALMLRLLQLAGLRELHVEVGHTGILQGLLAPLALAPASEARVFSCLRRKAADELAELLAVAPAGPSPEAQALLKLIDAETDASGRDRIKALLAPCGDKLRGYVDDLQTLAELTARQQKHPPLRFDVTESRGYRYHTGVTFVAYAPGQSQGVACGGRYDEVGRAFGAPRPATGFSADARQLLQLAPPAPKGRKGIFAPSSAVPGLQPLIETLRRQGEVVICDLPGLPSDPARLGCDRRIALKAGKWEVQAL